jgi:hypothetical protein
MLRPICMLGLSSVFGAEMKTFESPAGFYSIRYRSDWKVYRDENLVNIVPPDERGAVTISASHSDSGDMKPFFEVTREPFANLKQ